MSNNFKLAYQTAIHNFSELEYIKVSFGEDCMPREIAEWLYSQLENEREWQRPRQERYEKIMKEYHEKFEYVTKYNDDLPNDLDMIYNYFRARLSEARAISQHLYGLYFAEERRLNR